MDISVDRMGACMWGRKLLIQWIATAIDEGDWVMHAYSSYTWTNQGHEVVRVCGDERNVVVAFISYISRDEILHIKSPQGQEPCAYVGGGGH